MIFRNNASPPCWSLFCLEDGINLGAWWFARISASAWKDGLTLNDLCHRNHLWTGFIASLKQTSHRNITKVQWLTFDPRFRLIYVFLIIYFVVVAKIWWSDEQPLTSSQVDVSLVKLQHILRHVLLLCLEEEEKEDRKQDNGLRPNRSKGHRGKLTRAVIYICHILSRFSCFHWFSGRVFLQEG